uniref:Uncharacterized protein n=1 Tax=Leishmania guyanensis TaxID=5670 RepID=A0A1E1IWW8_LEIGU|nr:Hypothetical protein BN36_2333120 [Leishmania guyanensis]
MANALVRELMLPRRVGGVRRALKSSVSLSPDSFEMCGCVSSLAIVLDPRSPRIDVLLCVVVVVGVFSVASPFGLGLLCKEEKEVRRYILRCCFVSNGVGEGGPYASIHPPPPSPARPSRWCSEVCGGVGVCVLASDFLEAV